MLNVSEQPSERRERGWTSTAICVAMAGLMVLFPCIRAGYRCEVDYNEGWNVYNAALVANHQWLYPVKYGWMSVNYPMLWFVILAQLHRVTHDYLFTARTLSLVGLLGCCVFVGLILRKLGTSLQAAWLGGAVCLALFVTEADQYIGMADPQMFAQMLFLLALYVYVSRKTSYGAIGLVALIFVVAGSIKHNPIDVPLAVLFDLLVFAPRKALWFTACGVFFAAVSTALNIHYGGPFFVAELLAPREYSAAKAFTQGAIVAGPILLPLGVALYAAWTVRYDARLRIATLLLASSMGLGLYFGGGSGVSVNAYFSVFIAAALLVGLFLDHRVWQDRVQWPIAASACSLLLFAWLLIPWLLVPKLAHSEWNPVRKLADVRESEPRFDTEVAMLKKTNGPVLCESLLLCAFAGEPYVYDPFNATRLIHMHKLDPAPMVRRIAHQSFAAVQLDEPIEDEMQSERFDRSIANAIQKSYRMKYESADCDIYTPAK